jgi:hypothetical protein
MSVLLLEKKNLFFTKIQKKIIKIYKINSLFFYENTDNKIIKFLNKLNEYMLGICYITWLDFENFLKLFILTFCSKDDINDYLNIIAKHEIKLILSENFNNNSTIHSL